MRDLIALTARTDIISFASGLPAPDLLPVAELQDCLDDVIARDGARALQYGPPYPPLKEALVEHMARLGVCARPEEIFITTGAQQALDVLVRLLVDRGAPAVIEDTVYTGISQSLVSQGARILTVPTGLQSGIDVDAVEWRFESGPRPRLLVVVPDFHNPLGVTLSAEKRHRLIELGRRYRVPIAEDSPYSLLRYEGQVMPALKSLDEEGGVIFVGSFSKLLAPALRLGWIVAPVPLIEKLTVLKETADLETSALVQRAVAEFYRRGLMEKHLERVCRAYRERLAAMQAALAREMPSGIRWSMPEGGIFLWLSLPDGHDTRALLTEAVETERVAFIPGAAFSLDGHSANAMRLNFSNATPGQIDEGVARLGRVIQRAIVGEPTPMSGSTLVDAK
jgi:2-aminoadipate transaminase